MEISQAIAQQAKSNHIPVVIDGGLPRLQISLNHQRRIFLNI